MAIAVSLNVERYKCCFRCLASLTRHCALLRVCPLSPGHRLPTCDLDVRGAWPWQCLCLSHVIDAAYVALRPLHGTLNSYLWFWFLCLFIIFTLHLGSLAFRSWIRASRPRDFIGTLCRCPSPLIAPLPFSSHLTLRVCLSRFCSFSLWVVSLGGFLCLSEKVRW